MEIEGVPLAYNNRLVIVKLFWLRATRIAPHDGVNVLTGRVYT